MHNSIGLTLVDDAKDIRGIRSFVDDEEEKVLVILDCSQNKSNQVVPMLGGVDPEPGKILMNKIGNTDILYVFLPQKQPEGAYKTYGIDLINKFVGQPGYVLFFKPYHIYREGFATEIRDTLFAYPEISACYSDFDINQQGAGRQFLGPFSYDFLVNNTYIYNNIAIKTNIFQTHQIDNQLDILADYDLCLRVGRHGILTHIPEALYSSDRHTFSGIQKEQYDNELQYIKSKLEEN